MSLYIRIQCSFFHHRKTRKLQAAIGDDAFWLLPRLWSYAAEYHPDGTLPDYDAQELAACLGYNKDATSMLQALIACRWLDTDPLRIHDWEEHNGYHQNFAERAKKAAAARWEKERSKEKDTDKKEKRNKHCLTIASSMLQACELIYQAYPKHVAKASALKAIEKALKKTDDAKLLESVKAYATAKVGSDIQYIPHPATWFNQERYNDDPATWESKPVNGNSNAAPLWAKIKVLEGKERDLKSETSEDWQRREHPEKVKELDLVRADLEKLRAEVIK